MGPSENLRQKGTGKCTGADTRSAMLHISSWSCKTGKRMKEHHRDEAGERGGLTSTKFNGACPKVGDQNKEKEKSSTIR